jgi:hypothetical protein
LRASLAANDPCNPSEERSNIPSQVNILGVLRAIAGSAGLEDGVEARTSPGPQMIR